jgi:hypothetical protein
MGLRIMRVVGDDFDIFKNHDLIETIWRLRRPDGCWAFTSQAPVGRPEATAMALLTLRMYDRWEYIAQTAEQFQRILVRSSDPMLWRHVQSLSMTIPALATVAPDCETLKELVDVLWSAARLDERDGTMHWTRLTRLDPAFNAAVPSAAHTARAALALLHCFRATDGKLGLSPLDLQPAANWLLDHRDWSNIEEMIHRPFGQSRTEEVRLRHFTGAWSVRALLELDIDPTHERIVSTIVRIYDSHRQGVWDWGKIQRPVWATLDALRALETYALRASPHRYPADQGTFRTTPGGIRG